MKAVRGTERGSPALILIVFGFLSVVFTGQFPPYGNPNEISRLMTVYSFVEHGTFRIDSAVAKFGSLEDKSISDGHIYSNKAPGLAFAAIPVYRFLRIFRAAPQSPLDPIFVLLRILVVTPVCLLALARFAARLRLRAAPSADLVTAAVAFGTPFLFYSRTFFSHAWTASLVLLAWDGIREAEIAGSRRRVGALMWIAGVLAGWAVISEYPLAIVAGLLLLRAGSRRAYGRAALFAFGLALPAILLLVYDTICFGSPFVLSSARESLPEFASLAQTGFFGFGPPNVRVAFDYWVHPARGVLLFSPFLLWTVVGFERWRRSRVDRADWAFCLAAVVFFFVAMTGYPNWHGGWSFGTRYLLPILFPAGLALAWALDSPASRWGFAAAAVFAGAVHLTMAASFPHVPVTVAWPAANAALWFLERGWGAPSIFGDPAGWALSALAIHLFAGAVAFATAIGSAALPRGRAWLAAAAGIAVFCVSLAVAPKPGYEGRVWRADMLDRVSGHDPELAAVREVVGEARSPEEKRIAERLLISYGWRRAR